MFALIDYIQYCRRTGNYGENQRDAAMGALSFYDGVPDDAIAQLDPDDLIFTQRFGSILSWAVMYFGSSSVDHMALYLGDGKVMHQTINGLKQHTLRVIARDARLLFVKDAASAFSVLWGTDEGLGVLSAKARWFHGLPARIQLVFGGLEIIAGFYPESFRWKFIADVTLLNLLTTAPLYLLFGVSGVVPGAIIFAALIAVALYNRAAFRLAKRQRKPYELLSHPKVAYRSFFKNGGRIVTKLGTLVISDLGVLPLSVFMAITKGLGLGGEGSDDRADDELQEASEFGSSGVERVHAEDVTSPAKDNQGDQHQDE